MFADYFIQELPEDKICYWDLIFNEGSEEERDSSSAAIAACGLLELSRQLPLNDEKHGYYEKVALELLSISGKVYNGFTTRVELYCFMVSMIKNKYRSR